ncbi:MAG: MlaD family protein [Candidatus Omnitrophica bacterium]|nr:MlaD family protein [Candidatus Omnitrophota bacterium]
MESKPLSFEIKVGIFVFLGIVIMFVIVFSIGEFYILKPMYKIKVLFGFANGIEVGAPVRLAGVDVGEIEDIKVYYDPQLQQTKVLLLAKLKKEARVEKDAVCKINTLGLLGEKYLEISPGTATAGFLSDQEAIMGYDPIPMEEVTKTMKELSDTAKAVTESAKVILERLENGEGTIGKLLTEEKIYNDLQAFVDDIKKHPWKLLIKEKEKTQDDKTSTNKRELQRGFERSERR